MARRRFDIEFAADTKDAERGMQRLVGAVEGTEKKFTKFGSGVKTAMGVVATGAVASFVGDLASRGTEIATIQSKFDRVFGDSAAAVEQFADDNRQKLGDSKVAVQDQAAAVQDLLVPLGFARSAAADMTVEVLNLSGALSENTNGQITFADATERVRKAILGERESLEALGVKVLQSDVNARLAAKGQDKLTGAAKAQAEAVATLEIITAKSTDAIDAYAEGTNVALREANEMKSNINELKDSLAQLVEAGATPAVGALNDLVSALSSIGQTRTEQTIDTLVGRWKEFGIVVDDAAIAQSIGESHAEHLDDALATMGITMGDLTEAVRGGADGVDAMTKRLNEEKEVLSKGGKQRTAVNKLIKELGEEFLVAAWAVETHTKGLEIEAKAEERAAEVAGIVADKVQDTTDRRIGAARAAKDHAAAVEEETRVAGEAFADYEKAVKEAMDEVERSVDSATSGIVSAFDDLPEQIETTPEEMLEKLRVSAQFKEDYAEDMRVLAEGGLTELFDVFDSAGPEAAAALDQLLADPGGTLKAAAAARGHESVRAMLAAMSTSELNALFKALGLGWASLIKSGLLTLNDVTISLQKFGNQSAALQTLAGTMHKPIHLDHGGVVPGPRGAPVSAIVHGGETVLPTHRNGAAMGAINITVNPSAGMNEAQLARKVRDELERHRRRGGLR